MLAVQLTDSASRLAGGMFESLRGLCGGLERSTAWRVGVVASEDRFLAEDRALWGNIPLHIAPSSSFGRFGSAPEMARLTRQLAPEVIHLSGVWGPASIAASWRAQGVGRPRLMLSPHGMLEPWALGQSRMKKSLAWMVWTKGLLDQVDCLHALCEEEALSLRRLVPNHPIAVIPNGVSLPSKDLTEGARRKDVLFLGRIHPKKGLMELIQAWELLEQARGAGWRLIIAGWDDGGHEAALRERVARLQLSDSVVFAGPAFNEVKAELLRNASVFVLPSFSEGLPMAVLEAWSYQLPVLMTDECHLPDGFRSGAAVRCLPEPQSVATGLTTMLMEMDETARHTMGQRGRRLVEERFVWDQIGADLGQVYNWLLGGEKPITVIGELKRSRAESGAVGTPGIERTRAEDLMLAVQLTDSASRLAGGMFESLRGLCGGLERSTAWRVGVVASEDRFLAEDRALWGNIPLHIAPSSSFGRFGSAPEMARLTRQLAPEVIHLSGVWGPASIAASWRAQGVGRPRLMLSPRGMLEPWALGQSRMKKSLAWMVWTKGLLDQVDCLHALCEEEALSLRRLVPNHPIAVIPNGVSLPSKDLTEGARRKDVLFLGRIHPKKGLMELIQAWELLEQARGAGWRLIIAGWDDGGHEAALRERVARLQLSDSVVFAGPAFNEVKAELLRNASVFVLPSFSEGLPMAVLEAWSYQLPVLMTDECHLPDGFRSGAAVRCLPEPQSVATGLTTMLMEMDETARHTMGQRGRRLVEERFVWDQIGADLGQVYNWLLGGEKPITVIGELRARQGA